MATGTMSSAALGRLAELDAYVVQAKGREQRVQADRSRARREAAAAAFELDAYHEAVGAGELEDAGAEAKLAMARDQAAARAADPIWAARARGAEQARERAEAERDEFMCSHFADLAAEQAALDGPARDRLQAAYEEIQAAEGEFVARIRAWRRFAVVGLVAAADCPGLPTRGEPDAVHQRAARGFESPTPRPLRDVDGDQETA